MPANQKIDDYTYLYNHSPSRPMKYFKDIMNNLGHNWLYIWSKWHTVCWSHNYNVSQISLSQMDYLLCDITGISMSEKKYPEPN